MTSLQNTLAIGAVLMAAAWPALAQAPGDPGVARGAHVAARDCASCHAIGPSGESPSSGAPTFRQLRLRYNPISLERRLSAMPAHGHETMPPRALDADEVADLVAYIQTLEPAERGR